LKSVQVFVGIFVEVCAWLTTSYS